jgi:hypothetical protein
MLIELEGILVIVTYAITFSSLLNGWKELLSQNKSGMKIL